MRSISKTRDYLVKEFLDALKAETIPWERGWNQTNQMNVVSNYQYKGINKFLLSYISNKRGYTDPRWITFNQVKENEWKLKDAKGKGVPIEFWSPYDTLTKKKLTNEEVEELLKDESTKDRVKFICKTYYVFNASLVDGIPPYEQDKIEITNTAVQDFLYNYLDNENIKISHLGNEAYYIPKTDEIIMPPISSFKKETFYFDTLAHEIAHSTGSKKRLSRDLSGDFGSTSYVKEELCAEIASSFITAELGLEINQENTNRHKAYIQSWISILENNPNELFKAIQDAELVTDYVKEKGNFEFILQEFRINNTNDIVVERSILDRVHSAKIQKQILEHDVTDKDYLFNGTNLSGAGDFDKDLQVALATGKDLDGVDIPNDTPEERNAKQYTSDLER